MGRGHWRRVRTMGKRGRKPRGVNLARVLGRVTNEARHRSGETGKLKRMEQWLSQVPVQAHCLQPARSRRRRRHESENKVKARDPRDPRLRRPAIATRRAHTSVITKYTSHQTRVRATKANALSQRTDPAQRANQPKPVLNRAGELHHPLHPRAAGERIIIP